MLSLRAVINKLVDEPDCGVGVMVGTVKILSQIDLAVLGPVLF